MSYSPTNQHGFTLIECLVALAVLAVLLPATYTLIQHSQQSYKRCQTQLIHDTEAWTIQQFIRRDLQSARAILSVSPLKFTDKDHLSVRYTLDKHSLKRYKNRSTFILNPLSRITDFHAVYHPPLLSIQLIHEGQPVSLSIWIANDQ